MRNSLDRAKALARRRGAMRRTTSRPEDQTDTDCPVVAARIEAAANLDRMLHPVELQPFFPPKHQTVSRLDLVE